MENTTVGLRLIKLALDRPEFAQLTRDRLAKEVFGVTYETLRKWMQGTAAPSRNRATQIATRLGVPAETFMHGVVYQSAENSSEGPSPSPADARLAQSVSHRSVTVPPKSDLPAVEWRNSRMIEALDRFTVEAPDDSMAPIIKRGARVIFDRTLEPRSKDIVLVSAGGEWFIRTYVKAPARWEARPEDDEEATLYSDRDAPLEVLAVFDGVLGRRG